MTNAKAAGGFTAEERQAMRDRAREVKAAKLGADGEKDILAVIARAPEPERTLCERLHKLIRATAPGLAPRTWYGLPAYADRDGKVVCFFKPASRFKDRYLTLGFNDRARLDDGAMWPTSFAVVEWNAATEKRIRKLVREAVDGVG